MNLTIFDLVPQSTSASLPIDPNSLYATLEQVRRWTQTARQTVSVSSDLHLAPLGKTGRRNDDSGRDRMGSVAGEMAQRAVELAPALSEQRDLHPRAGLL